MLHLKQKLFHLVSIDLLHGWVVLEYHVDVVHSILEDVVIRIYKYFGVSAYF